MSDYNENTLLRLKELAEKLGSVEVVQAGTFSSTARVYSRTAGLYLTDVVQRDVAVPLVAAINALPALIQIVGAAEEVLSCLEYDQSSYYRNGPGFTSPAGNEYEETSSVLACSEERAEILRSALAQLKEPG